MKRRKTLGAFVPCWGPGPCRNTACAECSEYTAARPGQQDEEPPAATADTT
ncbi:hypothetical protein ACWEFL_01500 [Streptomyces sp. NPDC004838]